MAGTLITDRRTARANYKTLRKLGKGGMAEVYLARQEGMAGFRRLVVIKKILPQFTEVESVAQMLEDEARIAGQLSHPNLVQVFDVGKEQGQFYIVMEYVDGCDLATLARHERRHNSRMPLRLALRVVSEAAAGLDYAHRQVGLDGRPLNLVHRDVSPHNVLCSRTGAVKVTDFGIAKAVGKQQVTEVGVVKGKIQYMAPEQYTGGEVDARADIYSLGVVLYQLTTGKLPRVTQSGDIAMRRVIEGNVPRPSELRPDYPDELELLVLRALAHNPADRYRDAATFRDQLLEFARQNDLLAFPQELGDYVNSIEPPKPMLEKEQDSSAGTGPQQDPRAAPTKSELSVQSQSVQSQSVQSVIVTGSLRDQVADNDTDPPPITEVVGNSKKSKARAEKKASGGTPAVLPDEKLTPLPAYRQHHLDAENAGDPAWTRRPEDISTEDGRYPLRGGSGSSHATLWGLVVAVLLGVLALVAYLSFDRTPRAPATTSPTGVAPTTGIASPAKTLPSGPGAGALEIITKPKDAFVAVDGAQRCSTSPCRISGLPLHRELLVTVRKPGHLLWMQRVVLTEAEPKLLLDAPLRPAVAPDAGPSSTPTAKAGGRAGKAPSSAARGQVPAGAAKGSGKVMHSEGKSGVALLVADVRPAWAEVIVDGKKLGTTPLQTEIAPGRHTVELKNEQLKFHVYYKVAARKGKKVKISDTIQPPQPGGS